MLSSLCTLQIQGGIFEDKFIAPLFPKNEKICLIYGKNGSGKSSISKAIRDIQITASNSKFSIEFIGIKHHEINKFIHVFNEDFIQQRVKFFNNKTLDALVLLGNQNNLDDKIKIKQERLGKIENIFLKQREQKLGDLTRSITDSKSTIEKILKREGGSFISQGWAERERVIKNLRQNAGVKLQDWLVKEDPIENNLVQMQEIIDEKFKQLERSIDLEQIVDQIPNIPDINLYALDEQLRLDIQVQELSVREKAIFSLLKDSLYVKDIEKFFLNKKQDICPFCCQDVDLNYKDSFLKEFYRIFQTSESEAHISMIKNLKKYLIGINQISENFKKIDSTLTTELIELIGEYNELIESFKRLCDAKIVNPFKPIGEVEIEKIILLIAQLKEKLLLLDNKRIEFNQSYNQVTGIKNNLSQLNKQLGMIEIQEEKIKYFNLEHCKSILQKKISNLNKYKNSLTEEILKLNNEKKNTNIAIDILNHYLAYIFFSADRLQVKASDDGGYAVLVRGKTIKLSWLSEGEKNAIALAYFFSTLLEGKSENEYLKNDLFIVLDDPISSFDFSNKIGVFSFLRKVLFDILLGNPSSKILILTHQIETMFHLEKVHSDIQKSLKNFKHLSGTDYVLNKQHLDNVRLIPFNKNYNEYSYYIACIFEFATELTDNYEDVIGNMIRKVLEAFATFNYKMGTEELFYNHDVLNLITESKQEHYQNLMARLLLNNGSHYEETAKAFPEMDFYSFVDKKEKINTAKLVLYFLAMINPLHIKQHLKDGDKGLHNILSWEKQLFLDSSN